MNRLLTTLCLALLVAPALPARDLTSEEIDRARQYLRQTSTAFLDSLKGLSAAQLTFKPSPVRWSVAEVAEHIAASEDFLMNLVREKVMKAPARTEAVNVAEIDDFVLTTIPDRTKKAQAPEPLAPTNRFGSTADSVKHFQASRAQTLTFLEQNRDLRAHAIDSPLGKKLDAYQWLLFVSAHCERHTKQILEVKAEPGFPRK